MKSPIKNRAGMGVIRLVRTSDTCQRVTVVSTPESRSLNQALHIPNPLALRTPTGRGPCIYSSTTH